jgi:hypothetical protein
MSRYRNQVRDVSNHNTVVSPVPEQCFNAFLPVYDGGVDFVLYREADSFVHKVQLESRRAIEPEFGRRQYRGPNGGAIAFSTGALHEVTPITRCKRYAFVPFLYGQDDACFREANNAIPQEGETPYTKGCDMSFPATSPE